MNQRYRKLYNRLSREYGRFSVAEVYLVKGTYHVEYESGYEWIVGFCMSPQTAELCRERLRKELKEARRVLAPSYAEMSKARKAFNNTWRDDNKRDRQYFLEEFHTMDFIFRENLDKVFATMIDQSIPWPYSQIMGRNSHDGPIEYHVEPVPAVNSKLYLR